MDCRDCGRDGIKAGTGTFSLFGICRMCEIGRGEPPRVSRDCGGGVGKAFGGMDGEPSINAALIWFGEKGGVGASRRPDITGGRGVDPRDTVLAVPGGP